MSGEPRPEYVFGAIRAGADAFLLKDAEPEELVTDRERDVLAGVCRGLSNRGIADDLHLGPATVKTYISRLLEKFGTRSRVGLVIAAYECGLVDAG